MNYKSLSYISLLAIAIMSSCSNDNDLNKANSEYVNSVRVTVEDFQPESSTRTAYTVDGSGFHFHWTDGDVLGIYPVGGDQVKFPISNGDGSASATFDGGAWKLRSEYQYAAYYPFSADNYKIDQSVLPVSFTGQTQNGNGSTANLSAYDYLACAATAPDASGGVDLTMKHLGAFLRLQLTMPKADNYSSVTLESDGAEFVTSGTFDLTAATPAITPTETSSTYTIDLTNVSTTEKNQVVTVYAIVAPANLSGSNIKITVHGTGQTTYVQTVSGKNFVARSAYNIAVENFPSGTNASGEDVSWEEPSDVIYYEPWTSKKNLENNATDQYVYTIAHEAGSTLSFNWKVGSESGCDYFIAVLDDAQIIKASGRNQDRYSKTFDKAGTATLVVKYTKDISDSDFDDCAMVHHVKLKKSNAPNEGDVAGSHEYVDLGLSVKWATKNVGADYPEDYGLFFAWGETTGKYDYNYMKFEWVNYRLCDESYSKLTKYCIQSQYGYNNFIDNKITLEQVDDAATVNWGSPWRMPTKAEFKELRDNCTWTWVTDKVGNGYKVTSKINGNSIFIPASGYNNGQYSESEGFYWSSSLKEELSWEAYSLRFTAEYINTDQGERRCSGHSIRAVCP